MTSKIVLFFFIFIGVCFAQTNTPSIPGYKLVWADEFDYSGLPSAQNWSYDVGGSGWGNNEKQYYTEKRLENARVENGKLIIEAIMENYQGMNFTSARLVTKNKGDWTYGRMEIRAKLPYGRGTWPAIWMLPTVWDLGNKGWPDNGEIDIMEHVGHKQGSIHASIHCDKYAWITGAQKTAITLVPDCSAEFHNYIVEWNENEIKAYVDDKLYFVFLNENKGWEYWPFFKNFYIILNIAVGGNWGGAQGIDTTIFPQKMEIDYVRVYQKKL
jgi:beta-glucanase (GH16 family)